MADLEQKTMNDICESTDNNTAPKLPSQDTAAEETLWKKSMNRILVGITLTAITLNFGLLNYIFPTIGTMLLLFGFRALQHENKWFKRCFIISIIRTAYFFWMLIWNTTILHSTIYSSAMNTVLFIANLLLQFALFVHSAKSRAFSSRRQRSCPNCLVLPDMPPRFSTLQRLSHCPDHVYRLLPHYLQPE